MLGLGVFYEDAAHRFEFLLQDFRMLVVVVVVQKVDVVLHCAEVWGLYFEEQSGIG